MARSCRCPEHRCAPYDRADYPYPQSIEVRIVSAQGSMIYGPYSGRLFRSTFETDIEHVVAVSEAHDSGLCAADAETRRRFATDLLNLTLASPEMNRCGKSGKCAYDAAQWLPPMNQCWFAARIVAVRLKYRLTVDRREADALDRVLSAAHRRPWSSSANKHRIPHSRQSTRCRLRQQPGQGH